MNKRHKVVLALSMALAGFALTDGGTLSEALGIILVGASLAWLIGAQFVSMCAHFFWKRTRDGAQGIWKGMRRTLSVDAKKDGERTMTETQTPIAIKPYKWGRFQGWALIIAGLLISAAMMSVAYRPSNSFAIGFFRFDPQVLDNLREDVANGNYSGMLGTYIGFFCMTILLGVAILRKNWFTFILLALPLLRAAGRVNVSPLVLWICSLVYYLKRRSEFKWWQS